MDSDGLGVIKFGGVEAKGSAGLTDATKWMQLGTDTWNDTQNDITYTRSIVGTETQLLIHKGDRNLLVKGWSTGELGIVLGAGVTATPPTTTLTYTGNQRAPLNADGAYDWSATTWAADGTLVGGVIEANFNDVIYGSTGADSIDGLSGNDALNGDDGADLIDGGAGDDLISGGAGADLIYGGVGNDVIISATRLFPPQRSTPSEVWNPPAGTTVWITGNTWGVYKNNGGKTTNIAVNGSSYQDDAPDNIYAGDGDDIVTGGRGNDFIDGGIGNDTLWGNGGNDIIDGGDGDDSITGDGPTDPGLFQTTPEELHGDDMLMGGAGKDNIWGGSGNDLLNGGGDIDYLQGEAGDDILFGGTEADTLIGGAGNDILDGGAGIDYLDGGAGDDVLLGGMEADILSGGAGDDTYLNVDSDDTVYDGEGNNNIFLAATGLGAGGLATTVLTDANGLLSTQLQITLDTGNTLKLSNPFFSIGSDTLQFANGDVLDLETLVSESLFMPLRLQLGAAGGRAYGGAGADTLMGSAGADILLGYAGNDILHGNDGADYLFGGTGADTLQGGGGDDQLVGGADNDNLTGGVGEDKLWGEAGNDILDGGAGADILIGGVGDDTYLSVTGEDSIYDMEGNNTIVLATALGIGAGGLSNTMQINADGTQNAQLMIPLDTGDVLKLDNPYFANGRTTLQFANSIVLDLETLVGTTLVTPLTLQLGNAGGRVYGGGGADFLYGDSGKDTLLGYDGADSLSSSAGDDVLDGGAGNDILYGGAGNDTYLFSSGRDTLIDSEPGNTLTFNTAPGAFTLAFQPSLYGTQDLFFDLGRRLGRHDPGWFFGCDRYLQSGRHKPAYR